MSEATVGQTFGEYVGLVREAFGHADRHGPLLAYLQGLLLPGRRKCVEPMAARVDLGRVSARHQSMQEIGLDHYEGRGWLGFHHHATLCIAAYAFLVVERARLSPPDHREAPPFEVPPLPGFTASKIEGLARSRVSNDPSVRSPPG